MKDQLRYLGRKKTFQAADPFNLNNLLRDALLKRSIPRRKFDRLGSNPIMQFLDSEHGAYTRNQRDQRPRSRDLAA
jgi:hypothetical protein